MEKEELTKIPIEREVLKHIYSWMRHAYREFEDDDFDIIRVPLFTDEEISEVRRALKRKKI